MNARLLERLSQRSSLHLFCIPATGIPEFSWWSELSKLWSSSVVLVDFTQSVKNTLGIGGSLVLLSKQFQEDFDAIEFMQLRSKYASTWIILHAEDRDLASQLSLHADSIVWDNSEKIAWMNHKQFSNIVQVPWVANVQQQFEFLQLARKKHILSMNAPSYLMRLVQKAWWIIAILGMLITLDIPMEWISISTPKQDWSAQIKSLEKHSGIAVKFTGEESLFRASRYVLGKMTGRVFSETEVYQYLREWHPAKIDTTKLSKDAKGTWIPSKGTEVEFPFPKDRLFSRDESRIASWEYLTSLVSDPMAYITEDFDPQGTNGRKHAGVDIGARQGSRILAPFDGIAWTTTDDRGGEVIVVVGNKQVIMFMHCDQLLYLDGQDVMTGDPLATVGLTGHTTGPHAHVQLGLVNSKGVKSIGKIRFNLVSPNEYLKIAREK